MLERERGFREREKNRKREMRRLVWIEDRSAKRERERELCLSAKLVCFVCLFVSLVLYHVAGEYYRKPQPLD